MNRPTIGALIAGLTCLVVSACSSDALDIAAEAARDVAQEMRTEISDAYSTDGVTGLGDFVDRIESHGPSSSVRVPEATFAESGDATIDIFIRIRAQTDVGLEYDDDIAILCVRYVVDTATGDVGIEDIECQDEWLDEPFEGGNQTPVPLAG